MPRSRPRSFRRAIRRKYSYAARSRPTISKERSPGRWRAPCIASGRCTHPWSNFVSHPRPLVLHALIGLLAWSLVTGTLVGLASVPAQAKVPKAAFRYTAAIEPLANYVGQSTCSPAAKPGTSAFANLLLRTYPSSRSLGISRSCGVGGKSEHKEGRAFDWGVSVHRAGDRASVRALMKWLLKRDAYGNRYAMARRLGIQYMIWNRRIWGAYAAGSGWRKYTGSNPHTDHVHFS